MKCRTPSDAQATFTFVGVGFNDLNSTLVYVFVLYSLCLVLRGVLGKIDDDIAAEIGSKMLEIAKEKYTWDTIGRKYFELLD